MAFNKREERDLISSKVVMLVGLAFFSCGAVSMLTFKTYTSGVIICIIAFFFFFPGLVRFIQLHREKRKE